MPTPGNAGVVGTTEFVIVSGRNAEDTHDLFVCLDAETGAPYWNFTYEAIGNLDYGNSPRAAPLIADPYVYILGAFGHLHCLDIETGKPVWSKHLVEDFQGAKPIWGYCSSPLIVDESIIIQPGGKTHSMIALEPRSGKLQWNSAGRGAAYASPISFETPESKTIVAFDELSMGGWDAVTGERLWEYIPKHKSDFNVPTPIRFGSQLIVSSENNGTRLLESDPPSRSLPRVVASFSERTSDTHSPIRFGPYVAAVYEELILLDPQNGLKIVASIGDRSFTENTSLIAFEDRLMTVSEKGTVALFQLRDQKLEKLGQYEIGSVTQRSLSYPAMIGRKLIYRTSNSVVALEW